MVALMLMILLLSLGAASLLDLTVDSRDTRFSLGPIIGRHSKPRTGTFSNPSL